MRLHLIRHPRPALAAGICYGSSDVPASEEDLREALLRLPPRLPARVPVLSSPLLRCKELAMQLAGALHAAPPVVDARLAEMHFGDWELKSWDAIPRDEIDAWASDTANYRPGGGESVIEVAVRLAAFLADAHRFGSEDIVVVTHAGVIRLLLEIGNGADLHAAALAAARVRREIAFGEPVLLDLQAAAN